MKRSSLLALATLVIASSAPVLAQENLVHQHHGSGYTIQYPTGWRVLDTRSAAMTQIGGCDAIIAKGFSIEGTANLNVIIINSEMRFDAQSHEILKEMPTQAAAKFHGRVEDIIVRDETIGGQPGLVCQYDITVGGKKLTQMSFSMPKAGRTFIITCTGPRESFRSLEPTFRMMIASIEVSFLSTIPRWLLFGLIGGGLGLVATLLTRMFKSTPTPIPSYRI